ncbi:hypothetical protein [Syntrophotalea carbinolica]|nr:hypothetical protein [Syntrophotalea carbinolica]
MKRNIEQWRKLWLVLLAGVLSGCVAAPKNALFVDAGAWPATAGSVALVGVSFDERYRPLPQSGLDGQLLGQLRRVLERKGYLVAETLQPHRPERQVLTSVPAAELAARVAAPVDLVLAVHVDFLFSSATYSESNPPPEFEIAAEARLVDAKAVRDLWRDRGHALAGGAAAMPLRNPDYDRMRGLAELANDLFLTLPDAGQQPGVSSVE